MAFFVSLFDVAVAVVVDDDDGGGGVLLFKNNRIVNQNDIHF